jgi:2-polyprenyl-3-methyl-5-hydroxy-6-metoxy-1,4-benzoquinol methylase
MTNPANLKTHEQELNAGERYAFGANWARFLTVLDDDRILSAIQSLKLMLGIEHLEGKKFLDIGSGSGLFSLAARKLGATVFSFDYDPDSVACTTELKRRYYPDDNKWTVQTGSVLDRTYMSSLGDFDVVYSWGVLHHTGDMWQALSNAETTVKHGGLLFVALYNHQPFASRYWTHTKRLYNKSLLARPLIIAIHALYPMLPSVLLKKIQNRKDPRGMSDWYNLLDWLGGYPFEVAKPEEVFDFFKGRGFNLVTLKTVGGRLGCNEFVFQRKLAS